MPEKQRQCQEEKPKAKAVGRRKAYGIHNMFDMDNKNSTNIFTRPYK